MNGAIFTQFRATAFTADVGLFLHRHVHDAQYGPVVIYQRDVDGKFAVAVDEFLGAIERID
jgi:hypothetical protein